MNCEELYCLRFMTPHNIDQHLPILRCYASQCSHVSELGTERGWSTSALLASGAGVVRSYDIIRQPEVALLVEAAATDGVDYRFVLGDSREVDIEPTEFLLVDTEHTYEQVDAELSKHIDKVSRFLVFHDTVSFPEIIPAILKHCSGSWVPAHISAAQNGLWVLARK